MSRRRAPWRRLMESRPALSVVGPTSHGGTFGRPTRTGCCRRRTEKVREGVGSSAGEEDAGANGQDPRHEGDKSNRGSAGKLPPVSRRCAIRMTRVAPRRQRSKSGSGPVPDGGTCLFSRQPYRDGNPSTASPPAEWIWGSAVRPAGRRSMRSGAASSAVTSSMAAEKRRGAVAFSAHGGARDAVDGRELREFVRRTWAPVVEGDHPRAEGEKVHEGPSQTPP